jgi:DNA mismatch endonuclease (patch repair protein)
VFVDGCFWHGCPEHGTDPASNSAWWQTKLAANRARDADTTEHLEDLGWAVVRVWEHEEPQRAAAEVAACVALRLGTPPAVPPGVGTVE